MIEKKGSFGRNQIVSLLSGVAGIISLVILFMPLYVVTISSITDYLGALNLATGSFNYAGLLPVSLDFSVPVAFISIIGAIVAAISGFIAAIPAPGVQLQAKRLAILVVIGGALVAIGSVVTFAILMGRPSTGYATFMGMPQAYTSSLGWANYAAPVVGAVVIVLGVVMLLKKR